MSITLKSIADAIQQQTDIEVSIVGDDSAKVSQISTIDAGTESSITFLANSKYRKYLAECTAGAVILSPGDAEHFDGNALVMNNPYAGFAIVAQLLDNTPQQAAEIHPSAYVASDAEIASDVRIGANATVESGAILHAGVVIGAGCYVGQGTIVGQNSQVKPNSTLYHGVSIGKNCTIHSNTVIGADGFGYAPLKKDGNQHWLKIPQMGGVVIGDGTEIGASTTIDRGAIEDTKIGTGVIIDNQIQLGHNVEIGDYTAIAAATAIAGSTKVGKNVTIGGCCAISGHLNICDNAFITGRAFVMKDITEVGVYSSGMPAMTNKEWRNTTARYRKLTELFDRVKLLEKQLNQN